MRKFNIRPTIFWHMGAIHVGIQEKEVGGDYVARMITVSLFINPKRWSWGRVAHMPYDGPHCIRDFGPFGTYESWRWCLKCYPRDEHAR